MRYKLMEARDSAGAFAFLGRDDQPLPSWPGVTFAEVATFEKLEEAVQAFWALKERLART